MARAVKISAAEDGGFNIIGTAAAMVFLFLCLNGLRAKIAARCKK